MKRRALLIAVVTVAFQPVIVSAADVDANGNAMPESGVAGAGESQAELAKKLQNPVSNVISLPFQNNFDFDIGPNDDGFRYTLNFQPVIPISISKDFNLIIRTIVPLIHQDDVIPGTTQDGLSDITQSFFVATKKPVGGWIIGFGPVFLWPSATDDLLGAEKWGAGPTGIVLQQKGPWTYGILANHIWDYAGDSNRAYVSSTFLQPFLSYTTKSHTTFGINSESTYDWHNEQWTVPINISVTQLTKIRKIPIQFALGFKVFAEGPSGNADWGIRFTITPVIPVGAKPPASHAVGYTK
jgi:hypothetical protein